MSGLVRVNFIVEGQTEETFVRDMLQACLATKEIWVTPRRVETGRRRGRIFRGGMTSFAKARRDIERWLAEDPTAYLTTMFDLYRLPNDFPQYGTARKQADPYKKAMILEKALGKAIGNPRFIPYIQLHEFEGLLFSNVEVIDAVLSLRGPSRIAALQAIRDSVESPEEINDGEDTAPSKRLFKLYPGYDKPLFGPQIAQRIGLDSIRSQCPHFNRWLERIEALSEAAS